MANEVASGLASFATGFLESVAPAIRRKKREDKLANLYAKVREGFKDPAERDKVIGQIIANKGTVTREMIQGKPDMSFLPVSDKIDHAYKIGAIDTKARFQYGLAAAEGRQEMADEKKAREHRVKVANMAIDLDPNLEKQYGKGGGEKFVSILELAGEQADVLTAEMRNNLFGRLLGGDDGSGTKTTTPTTFDKLQAERDRLKKGKNKYTDWKSGDFRDADAVGWTKKDIQSWYGINPNAIADARKAIIAKGMSESIELSPLGLGIVVGKWARGEEVKPEVKRHLDKYYNKLTQEMDEDALGAWAERAQRLQAKHEGLSEQEVDDMDPVAMPVLLQAISDGMTKTLWKKQYEEAKRSGFTNWVIGEGEDMRSIPITEEMYQEVLNNLPDE